MNQEQINSKFADFLGWQKLGDGRYHFSLYEPTPTVKCPPEQLRFHQYWNWMMQVVEKIEALPEHPIYGRFDVHILNNNCTIRSSNLIGGKKNQQHGYFADHQGETKLGATWNACSLFLDWYKTISY